LQGAAARARQSLGSPVIDCVTSGTQVSAKSGVFLHVDSNSGGESPSLTVLESVQCLECGAVYAKPAGGGTVRENPGCPECTYVGWVQVEVSRSFSEAWMPPRSDAGHLPHPHR
jgi:hypothetical protein